MSTIESNVSPIITSLEERLRFEEFISELSARFVNLDSAEVDIWIEKALKQVVEFLNVDRSSLWQVREEDQNAVLIHAYSKGGVPSEAKKMKLTRSDLPWMSSKFKKGEMFSFSSLGQLPPEAKIDRELFDKMNVKSNITIPLSISGSIQYFLTVGFIREEKINLPQAKRL